MKCFPGHCHHTWFWLLAPALLLSHLSHLSTPHPCGWASLSQCSASPLCLYPSASTFTSHIHINHPTLSLEPDRLSISLSQWIKMYSIMPMLCKIPLYDYMTFCFLLTCWWTWRLFLTFPPSQWTSLSISFSCVSRSKSMNYTDFQVC